MQDTKTCKRCGVERPLTAYDRNSIGNRRGICRKCRAKPIPEKPCAICRKLFRPKHHENATYCSRQCAQVPQVEGRMLGRFTPIAWGACRACAAPMWWRGRPRPSATCSEPCRRAVERERWHAVNDTASKHARVVVVCAECGGSFEYSRYNRPRETCSPNCRNRLTRRRNPELYAALKLKGKAARRAKVRSANAAEIVVSRVVFERDGWMCWLCSEPLDRMARHPSPLAPTLDHVVPVSKGGPHTYANIRAAHSRCNMKRGNREPTPDGWSKSRGVATL